MIANNNEAIKNCVAGSGYLFTSDDPLSKHTAKVEETLISLAQEVLLQMPPRLEKKRLGYSVELVLSDSSLKLITSIMLKSFGISTVENSVQQAYSYCDHDYLGKPFFQHPVNKYTLTFNWIDETAQTVPGYKYSAEEHNKKFYESARTARDRVEFKFDEDESLCAHPNVLASYCPQMISDASYKPSYSRDVYKAIFEFIYLAKFPEINSYDKLEELDKAVTRLEVSSLHPWVDYKMKEYKDKFRTDVSYDFRRSLELSLKTEDLQLMGKCFAYANERTHSTVTLLENIAQENAKMIAGNPLLYNYPVLARKVAVRIADLNQVAPK